MKLDGAVLARDEPRLICCVQFGHLCSAHSTCELRLKKKNEKITNSAVRPLCMFMHGLSEQLSAVSCAWCAVCASGRACAAIRLHSLALWLALIINVIIVRYYLK